MSSSAYRAIVTLPAVFQELDIARLAQGLEDLEPQAHVALRQGDHRGPWKVEWIFYTQPDQAMLLTRLSISAALMGLDLPDDLQFTIEPIDMETDWLQQCYQSFPPFSVGPFFIYGSHYEEGVPEGLMGMQIDAASAFGSGEHGTTKGCLQAMLEMKAEGQCPWNVLDMGTGSGILAIAAWKLWKTPILAADIDEESVRVCRHHAQLNGVKEAKGALSCVHGDGFATGLVQQKAPYDLIIANILAGPLIDMAQDLVSVLDENGYVILSGMLNEQCDKVCNEYEKLNLKIYKRFDIDDWSTVILRN